MSTGGIGNFCVMEYLLWFSINSLYLFWKLSFFSKYDISIFLPNSFENSLLTGFKWLYDKKKNNLKQEIKLVEYCSKLGRNSQFQFNKNNQKTFSAIWCDCLKYDGNYEKNVYRENEKIVKTKEKQNAIENYDPNENYVAICNYDLRKIFVSDMS